MIASLEPTGMLATVMPHGVLFRSGKEKIIREGIIKDNLIEAIIGLPMGLFYGTGIPACIIIINKNKPDTLRDKIFFINADREFAEGKNQNKLRPEDIEKIVYTFDNKLQIPKYSKLIDVYADKAKSEEENKQTVEGNDFSLNIRRYVDNTPEPENEDAKAHLVGGVPVGEIEALKVQDKKFDFDSSVLFNGSGEYLSFAIGSKEEIKPLIESDTKVTAKLQTMQEEIKSWWQVAQNDFSKLEGNNILPTVRSELIGTLKSKLIPHNTLDDFQVAGVFVNWWQNIKYDLKTIIYDGWSVSLIPDEMIVSRFFEAEQNHIYELESKISEKETELAEAIEAVEYEVNENEEKTKKIIIDYLKNEIKDLKQSTHPSAKKEREAYEKELKNITDLENELKDLNKELSEKEKELRLKVKVKKYGIDEEIQEYPPLLQKAKEQLESIKDKTDKESKSQKTALNKDIKILEYKITHAKKFLEDMGGIITTEEAKELILEKLYNQINGELERYLNSEKRAVIANYENLFDKYFVSLNSLKNTQTDSLSTLNDYLKELGYIYG